MIIQTEVMKEDLESFLRKENREDYNCFTFIDQVRIFLYLFSINLEIQTQIQSRKVVNFNKL